MNNHAKQVIVIPAKEDYSILGKERRLVRVASYSRVSTDFEEQLTSFHTQKTYYTDLIMSTPGWKLAGTYADEGISGASAEKRPDFMKMIRHCKNGKIDLVITKSISRFARNTLDSIGYVRKLKSMGVGVLFEKENINTLEQNSEVVMTILASLAQEELNSMSMNIKMGKRMAMKDGKAYFGKLYGYTKDEDGTPRIVPEQAEIVERIYKAYLSGKSGPQIRDELNAENIPSSRKGSIWADSTVRAILKNERYAGDMLLQKTFITDPLTKKVIKNTGQLPKYYVKNNHEGIVSREMYERVQEEFARRSSRPKVTKTTLTEQGKYSAKYALNDILVCGQCGTPYKRVRWTKRSGEKQYVWRCYKRLDYGIRYCTDSVTVDEESLHTAIMEAIASTSGQRMDIATRLTAKLENVIIRKSAVEIDVQDMQKRIDKLKADVMEKVANDPRYYTDPEYIAVIQQMSQEARELTERLEEYRVSGANVWVQKRMDVVKETLYIKPDEYDDTVVRQLIHTIKVVDVDRILVRFKSGVEVEQVVVNKVRRLRG